MTLTEDIAALDAKVKALEGRPAQKQTIHVKESDYSDDIDDLFDRVIALEKQNKSLRRRVEDLERWMLI